MESEERSRILRILLLKPINKASSRGRESDKGVISEADLQMALTQHKALMSGDKSALMMPPPGMMGMGMGMGMRPPMPGQPPFMGFPGSVLVSFPKFELDADNAPWNLAQRTTTTGNGIPW